MSGLPPDNFLKKTLLQAFLCVNNFDIVVLGETHLTSKIDNNDLEIEGYSFEHSDHPDGDARGGIGIYYKSSLPCIFKPELTTLKGAQYPEIEENLIKNHFSKNMFF